MKEKKQTLDFESKNLPDLLLQFILQKMRSAEILIIASPVYLNDVNGVMKNWVDRLAFICHRPEFANKLVYLITTVGGNVSFQALLTLGGAFSSWGGYIIGKSGFKMG